MYWCYTKSYSCSKLGLFPAETINFRGSLVFTKAEDKFFKCHDVLRNVTYHQSTVFADHKSSVSAASTDHGPLVSAASTIFLACGICM